MALQGVWFDGKTSASLQVELHIDDAANMSVVDVNTQQVVVQVPFSVVRVSSRVGNVPRYLYFPDGEKCETRQHDLVDQWLHKYRPSFWNNLAHQLETHTYFVALTVALVATFTWAVVVYGLPASARYIAYNLPQGVMNRAASETLEFLDKTQLKATGLDKATREQLLKDLSPAITQNKDLHINVIFRRGGAIGANAFALPDGTVLFTDEIVQLAKNNDELIAVLAHEIGHVKYRHSLRSVIQGSVISFGVAMITGDLSAASNLLASLPVIMTSMSYSRDFEREADDNSLVFLDANHIERHHFVDLMERLTYQAQCSQLIIRDNLNHKIKAKISPDSDSKSSDTESDNAHFNESDDEDFSDDEDNDFADNEDDEDYDTDFDDDDANPPFDVEAHRAQCDKLIADYKDDFFHSKLMGYFASHPETDERTQKFKAQPAAAKENTQ
jgi:Zn-dependent protease with chaperone function